jgi:hypothetical protein
MIVTFLNTRAVSGALLVVLLAWSVALTASGQGRRVVDVVRVGDSASEREHDYTGERVSTGLVDGRTYRQASGWMSYSMTVYEDSEVTLNCTFRGSEGRRLVFDLLVEGRKIATHTFVSPSPAAVNVELRVPMSVTRGLTGIRVTLRAQEGPTPGLLELRTVQEHLELSPGHAPAHVIGSAGAVFW